MKALALLAVVILSSIAHAGERSVNVMKCEEKIRAVALENYKAGRAWGAAEDEAFKPGSTADKAREATQAVTEAQSKADHATAQAISCLYE